jgi:hypothetical protein
MPNIPSNVSYGTVTGRFILAYGDTSDSAPEPDAIPASGSVFFTASPILLKNTSATPSPVTILPATVEVPLDADGYLRAFAGVDGLGVRLIATNDADNNPVNWTWAVEFRLTDETGAPVEVPGFSFSLPANTTVDLAQAAPVPQANGTFYVVGPQGPAGEGLQIDGTVASQANLPPTGNTNNDAYITQDTGNLWIWLQGAWVDTGPIRGPGVAAGGVANNFLVKSNSTDYATQWTNTIDGGNA